MVPTAQGSAAALVAGGTVTGATLKHKASWETGLYRISEALLLLLL